MRRHYPKRAAAPKARLVKRPGESRVGGGTYGSNHQRIRKLMIPAAHGTKCPSCDTVMNMYAPKGHPTKPELDHIYPVAKDGVSIEENYAVRCGACNRKKGARTEEDFGAGRYVPDALALDW